jgi:hypothetical protein
MGAASVSSFDFSQQCSLEKPPPMSGSLDGHNGAPPSPAPVGDPPPQAFQQPPGQQPPSDDSQLLMRCLTTLTFETEHAQAVQEMEQLGGESNPVCSNRQPDSILEVLKKGPKHRKHRKKDPTE